MMPNFCNFIICCAVLLGPVQGSTNNKNFLMVGGYRPTDIEQLAKYVVSLRIRRLEKLLFGAGHYCGGTIIGKRLILTAAHCLINPEGNKIHEDQIVVVSGTPERVTSTNSTVEYRVSQAILHNSFASLKHDIGILKLKDSIVVNEFADIAAISKRRVPAHELCTTLGWGRIFEDGPLANEIVYVDVYIFSKASCTRLVSEFSSSGMICALNNNQDPCQGDSGGPLFCGKSVAGIVSFGHGCARQSSPSAFTDVYHYRKWIKKNGTRCTHTPSPVLIGIMLTFTYFGVCQGFSF